MSELKRLRKLRDAATISELYDLIGELEEEIERLTRERDEARDAACWMYESDGDAHDKETARQRWHWICYRREGEG